MKTDGSCTSCSTVSTNCKVGSLAADTDGACQCSECRVGYYLDSDKKCSNTVPDYCLFLKTDITKEPTCYACFIGYKWVSSTKKCTKCDGKDVICPTLGCSALSWPDKPVP